MMASSIYMFSEEKILSHNCFFRQFVDRLASQTIQFSIQLCETDAQAGLAFLSVISDMNMAISVCDSCLCISGGNGIDNCQVLKKLILND